MDTHTTMMLELTGDVRRHAHTAESEREAKESDHETGHPVQQVRTPRRTTISSETEGCMKHEPNGREKSETDRDWDPRTHEQTARDWDPRTHYRKSNANSRQTKSKMSARNV